MAFEVHLVDGTYELFRYHFALPSHRTRRATVRSPRREACSAPS